MNQIAHAIEELQNHVPDVLPISGEYGEQGAQVEQHVKKGGTDDAPETFSRCSAMARWPELDTGRNSVTPWMTPRRTEENRVKGFTLLTWGFFHAEYSIPRTGCKFQSYFQKTKKTEKGGGRDFSRPPFEITLTADTCTCSAP